MQKSISALVNADTASHYNYLRETFGNVLPMTLIQATAIQLNQDPNNWFIKNYQGGFDNTSQSTFTLLELLNAVNNSENKFQQYPVVPQSVRQLAKSIFIEEYNLLSYPTVTKIEKNAALYIVGGRHRVYAIASVVAECCYLLARSVENVAIEIFDKLCKKVKISADFFTLKNEELLVKLIPADNNGRAVRASEQYHLKLQTLGINPSQDDKIVEVINEQKLDPKERVALAAQIFTKKQAKSRLKAQTLQAIGSKIAAYLLYGVKVGGRLTHKLENLSEGKEEIVEKKMNLAFNILQEKVKENSAVARNAREVAMIVINELEDNENARKVSQTAAK